MDTLQNERRDLKEKLRFTTKKNLIDTILNKPMSETSPSSGASDSPLSKANANSSATTSDYREQEVKLSKYVNRILLKHNTELKQYLTQRLLVNLPPLPSAVHTEENFIRNDDDSKQISSLITKSNNLMKVKSLFFFTICRKILGTYLPGN